MTKKSRNTTSEYLVQNIAILEILLIISEINQTDVHRSVCEFYVPFLIVRIPIKKAYHERNRKKTGSRIVISENTQNEVLETFIDIKMDAESNETAPVIAFLRVHEDSEMSTKKSQKGFCVQPKSSS